MINFYVFKQKKCSLGLLEDGSLVDYWKSIEKATSKITAKYLCSSIRVSKQTPTRKKKPDLNKGYSNK